ncbi:hypothetical protein [Clostridium algidicarnis]|uniref:hypothetical protein n=1 Tax=Clostridium algidicarnis TaxID=37659 RepID=UPI001C0BE0B3|nr:hypothetical protein [Clostridium algidicarnis]MBU3227715.1 hypothetical protein [Clostridium algidicarnis]MBU3251467.1 hypothetical protein [Clostridium algidicarnis]
MKNYIRIEIRRALFNRITFLAILIGIICMVFGAENYLFDTTIKTDSVDLFRFAYSSGTSSILVLIAPILVCLPFSTSYLEEKQTYFYENIFIRINKIKYLVIKILVNGLVGGLIMSIILTISFIIFFIIKGWHINLDLANSLDLRNIYAYLCEVSPFAYVFFIIISSFFGGFTFATMSLSISTVIRNRYLASMFPFLFNILTGIFLVKINNLFYTVNFLDVSYFNINWFYIIIYELLLLTIFIGIFLHNGLKEGAEVED